MKLVWKRIWKTGNQEKIKSNGMKLEWKRNRKTSTENITVQYNYIEYICNRKIMESKTTNQVEAKF